MCVLKCVLFLLGVYVYCVRNDFASMIKKVIVPRAWHIKIRPIPVIYVFVQ